MINQVTIDVGFMFVQLYQDELAAESLTKYKKTDALTKHQDCGGRCQRHTLHSLLKKLGHCLLQHKHHITCVADAETKHTFH